MNLFKRFLSLIKSLKQLNRTSLSSLLADWSQEDDERKEVMFKRSYKERAENNTPHKYKNDTCSAPSTELKSLSF